MLTILIVAGSAADRATLRGILEAAGYRVVEAGDGPAAWQAYTAARPALAIVDALLARAARPPILSRLRDIDPYARVLLCTADVHCAVQEGIDGAEASGLVLKPFVADQVLEAIEAALE